MAEVTRKSLDAPEEVITFPKMTASLVELGDLTVGLFVSEPGWRWSEHTRPTVGGEWCQARHIGVVISGRLGIDFSDGTSATFGPNDVFDIPPGHDGYTFGDETLVQIEWSGIRAWAGFPTGVHSRVLRTLLFTDLVDSTPIASRLGDARWRELLSEHFVAVRAELERFQGREVATTGDGVVATFDGPARALHCAAAIRKRANAVDLHVRAGIHVGEVELVGDDVRGVAMHEAARIMAAADTDEILASELTRALAGATDLQFEDRGTRELKGLDGEWKLAAFVSG
jgi:class 3 adenylate cyclase